jgi:hypothetical protein
MGMNDFTEGLATEHLGRSNALATKYQLRQTIDLPTEIKGVVQDAIDQARVLGKDGDKFLARLKGRLTLAADVTETPETTLPNKLTDLTLNLHARATALRAIATEIDAAQEQMP